MSILSCENISRYYQGSPVISGIDLHVNRSELVSLVGPSGAGKTTLFNILSGVDIPDEGHVFLQEKDITGVPGKVSYMLQKNLLLPYKTVLDNVTLPLVIKGMGKEEAREKGNKLLPKFGLKGYGNRYPSELSGGMGQRAALLRTYFMDSPVLLLDEPFSALDAITKLDMQQWFVQLVMDLDKSTLFITHDIDEALLLSHRIYVLSGKPGVITQEFSNLPPWPRSQDFLFTPEFAAFKRQILTAIA